MAKRSKPAATDYVGRLERVRANAQRTLVGAALTLAALLLVTDLAAHVSVAAAAKHLAAPSPMDDYTVGFQFFALFTLMQTLHTFDA